jgi:general L-amino acid transport system permease protein
MSAAIKIAEGRVPAASTTGIFPYQSRSIRQRVRSLFGTPLNAVISLVCIWLIWRCVKVSFNWLILHAVFEGGRQDCAIAYGACWPFLLTKLRFVLFGTYPYDEQWRMALSLVIFSAAVGLSMLPRLWGRWLITVWLVTVPLLAALMWGGVFGLRYVPTLQWSGLPLSLMLSFIGIVLGFPVGVLLAMARTGPLPAIRGLATLFIEIVRSLPLVTIMFMAAIMLPLFMRSGAQAGVLLRVQVAIILFAGVYIAETVRGGLQAVPREQFEAAQSLGLRYWQIMGLVVVPQALRIVIPSLVIIAIGFFQDTALVTVVGLMDFLSTVRSSMHDPNWEGVVVVDGYLFAGAVYFAISFGLGAYGRFVERRAQMGGF